MGALLGDEVVEAGPGDLVYKPRNQWHTFWNAGDAAARILEIISPAGFGRFFAELVDLGALPARRRRSSVASAHVTGATWTHRASRGWSSGSVCAFPVSRSKRCAGSESDALSRRTPGRNRDGALPGSFCSWSPSTASGPARAHPAGLGQSGEEHL